MKNERYYRRRSKGCGRGGAAPLSCWLVPLCQIALWPGRPSALSCARPRLRIRSSLATVWTPALRCSGRSDNRLGLSLWIFSHPFRSKRHFCGQPGQSVSQSVSQSGRLAVGHSQRRQHAARVAYCVRLLLNGQIFEKEEGAFLNR